MNLARESTAHYIFHMTSYGDLGSAVTFKLELPGGQGRLKEAAIYVMDAAQNFEYFGLIKLNKMLWRADFRSFLERRFPVTGRPYQKLEHGPAPVEMKPVLRDLERAGAIRYVDSGVPKEQRPVPDNPPRPMNLSPRDIQFLDEAVEHYRDMTAKATSRDSHGVAWSTRSIGDLIPYDAAIFDDDELPQGLEHKFMWLGRERGWHSH
ncbi:MAG TPA: Panacea domain-containing protein [Devosia sp.]